MVEVSIICLIYKSTKLAEMIYDSLHKYTPMLENGKADFFFVANDPTKNIIEFLEEKKYPYIINHNDILSEKEMFENGFAKPEYMRRVYRGYNYGILNAKGKRVVLINSDNFFSKDWLENLLKYSEYKNVVSSTLVEPKQPKYDIFPGALRGDFGMTAETYNDENFQIFANKIRKTGISIDGAYMPCILYRDAAIYAGLYPEGNLAGDSFEKVSEYGDVYFYKKMSAFGLKHYTAKDSIVYHMKEGEKSESDDSAIDYFDKADYKFRNELNVKPKNLNVMLRPTIIHDEIIDKLLKKVTIVVFQTDKLFDQIEYINDQDFNNIEILILYKKLNKEIKKLKNVILMDVEKTEEILNFINYNSFGNYILYLDDEIMYSNDFIDKRIKEYGNNKNVFVHKESEESHIKRGESLFPKFFVKNNSQVLFSNKSFNTNCKYQGEYILNIIDESIDIKASGKDSILKRNYIKRLLHSMKHDGIILTYKKIYKKLFKK